MTFLFRAADRSAARHRRIELLAATGGLPPVTNWSHDQANAWEKVKMKAIAVAAILTLISSTAMADTCAATSAGKNLAGAAKTSFMTKCTKDAQASCQAQATDKKIYGAAATSFVKKCTKDAVGQ
ncbi:hypothetical protein V5G24_04025 [Xanthobacter sp. VTT E-85241]|uniref:hypothetical protein n=1 Tax=Roseixanthobacter finlandensis TaxID=3119922 RepID=UPI00372BA33F